jgi:hypothetical protein
LCDDGDDRWCCAASSFNTSSSGSTTTTHTTHTGSGLWADIYYTLDGSQPIAASKSTKLYKAPSVTFKQLGTLAVTAVAVKPGMSDSPVVSRIFRIEGAPAGAKLTKITSSVVFEQFDVDWCTAWELKAAFEDAIAGSLNAAASSSVSGNVRGNVTVDPTMVEMGECRLASRRLASRRLASRRLASRSSTQESRRASTASVEVGFSVTVGYDHLVPPTSAAASSVKRSIGAIDHTQFASAMSTSAAIYGLGGSSSTISFAVSQTASFQGAAITTTAASATSPGTTASGSAGNAIYPTITRKAFFAPGGVGCSESAGTGADSVKWRLPADGRCHYVQLYARSLHYAGSYARVVVTSASRDCASDVTVYTYAVSDCTGLPLTTELVPAKQVRVRCRPYEHTLCVGTRFMCVCTRFLCVGTRFMCVGTRPLPVCLCVRVQTLPAQTLL